MLHSDDRDAITQTLSLQGHLVDDGEHDRLGEVFTSDVVYELGAAGVGTVEGIDQVRRAARGMAERVVGLLAHHLANVVITDGEDDATAKATSKILLLMRTGQLQSAVQHDALRREDGAWRISHRVVTPLGAVTQGTAR